MASSQTDESKGGETKADDGGGGSTDSAEALAKVVAAKATAAAAAAAAKKRAMMQWRQFLGGSPCSESVPGSVSGLDTLHLILTYLPASQRGRAMRGLVDRKNTIDGLFQLQRSYLRLASGRELRRFYDNSDAGMFLRSHARVAQSSSDTAPSATLYTRVPMLVRDARAMPAGSESKCRGSYNALKLKPGLAFFRFKVDDTGEPVSACSDRDTVLAAVKQRGEVLDYASKKLKGDKDVVIEAVRQSGRALQYASSDLRASKEVVLLAVKQDGDALQYASGKLKKDKVVVLAAVEQDGSSLRFAGTEMRKDMDVVRAAVGNHGLALRCAEGGLRGNKDLVLAAISQHPYALESASPALKADPEVVTAALMHAHQDVCSDLLRLTSNEIRSNKPFVLAALSHKCSCGVMHLGESLRGDREVAAAAILQASPCDAWWDDNEAGPTPLHFFSEELKSDPTLLRATVAWRIKELEYALEPKEDPDDAHFDADDLLFNRDFVLEAVSQRPVEFLNVRGDLQEDFEVVRRALRQPHCLWPWRRD